MSFDKKELKKLLDGKELKSTEDLQGLLRDLTKEVIEAVYDGELTHTSIRYFKNFSSHT